MKPPEGQSILFKGKTEKFKSYHKNSKIHISSLDNKEYAEDEEEIMPTVLSIEEEQSKEESHRSSAETHNSANEKTIKTDDSL